MDPTIIDARYALIDVIGRGGSGVVYRALDTLLERDVALKVLVAEGPSAADARARFRQEARIAARIDHPNVLAMHDLGTDGHPYGAGGTDYYTMPLVEGESLASVCRSELPSPRRALRIVRMLADAMSAVHAAGVAHRDLTPANILISATGVPTIIDFGLARLRGGDAADDDLDAGLDPDHFLGTPAYMAPERIEHGPTSGDERTDVYGLGAILYHLLTGRAPIASDHPNGIHHRVLVAEPIDPRRLRQGLDPRVAALCLRCLAKRPEERFHDARALREAIDRLLERRTRRARLPVASTAALWLWLLAMAAAAGLLSLDRPGDSPSTDGARTIHSGLAPGLAHERSVRRSTAAPHPERPSPGGTR